MSKSAIYILKNKARLIMDECNEPTKPSHYNFSTYKFRFYCFKKHCGLPMVKIVPYRYERNDFKRRDKRTYNCIDICQCEDCTYVKIHLNQIRNFFVKEHGNV